MHLSARLKILAHVFLATAWESIEWDRVPLDDPTKFPPGEFNFNDPKFLEKAKWYSDESKRIEQEEQEAQQIKAWASGGIWHPDIVNYLGKPDDLVKGYPSDVQASVKANLNNFAYWKHSGESFPGFGPPSLKKLEILDNEWSRLAPSGRAVDVRPIYRELGGKIQVIGVYPRKLDYPEIAKRVRARLKNRG